MAKKSRRSRAQAKAPVKRTESKNEPGKSGAVNAAVRITASSLATNASLIASMELRRKYVLTELRWIGIIAGSLIVILIILTFVLG